MKIVAYMPVKDEVNRHLRLCLSELQQVVDDIIVYDDQSTDGTPELARAMGCHVAIRPVSVPSFMQHEGQFRQAAWNFTCNFLEPGDWCFAVDADEFVGHPDGNTKEHLYAACSGAAPNANAILVQKHEVFGFDDDGTPLIRVDGQWGNIIGTRLFRYLAGGVFANRAMGSGCEPTYVTNRTPESRNHGIYLLHYGYVNDEERAMKHQRYSTLVDHGHSNRHIQSIVQSPTLKRFDMPYPKDM